MLRGKVSVAVSAFGSSVTRPAIGAPPFAVRRLAEEMVISAALSTSVVVGLITSRSMATLPSNVSCAVWGVTAIA